MKVAWCLGQAMAGILFWGACEPVAQDYASYPSLDVSPLPGAALPPEGPLHEAAVLLDGGQAKDAVKILSGMQPITLLEKAWQRLLLGEAYLEIGAKEKALQYLLANYEELRDARPAPEPERSLVLARSLKKLGSYYRDKADYEKAYALHQLQWLYMRRLGTPSDRFEVLLHLDADAALLRNYFASEQWLREALLLAQGMPVGQEKQRALIVVWDHVALRLSELVRFSEAEAAARESRRISQLYDAATERREFREIQAAARQADVHQSWARFTEAKNPAESKPLYAKAQALAREALLLAEQQGMGEPGRATLEQEMRRICGQACRS
ncbi:MAG TPA: hypothetical protein VFO10_15370 [Oligoflexus sp.]|uniref:hypothetical protein n=1 Tax=Oligoflexus sp. TaxID=1971216 RepID=UPI002D803ABA|nr:hypothetical protein [Oligoflexus sp.]HET9238640.1 hypothetical protein [Oligoflexus sp.]